jgi:hypothetical protein
MSSSRRIQYAGHRKATTLFLLATFAGALVAGLSGFAFGLVASAIWLYILCGGVSVTPSRAS